MQAIDIQKANLTLLNVGYVDQNVGCSCFPASGSVLRLYYVKEGNVQVISKDGICILLPNQLYLTKADIKFEYVNDCFPVVYYIRICENTGFQKNLFEHYDFPKVVNANQLDPFLIKRLCEINSNREYLKSMMVKIEEQAILQVLLSRFIVINPEEHITIDGRIRKVLLYIHKNLNVPIKISDLLDICSLNRSYFIHLFKKEIGISPIQYINQKKIEKSQKILLFEDITIQEAAYGVAIDNIPYFNRLFKKVTGQTPTDWLRLHKRTV